MAFGMMTQRFGVLACPLRVDPRRIGTLMETIARIHNYTINYYHGLVNEDAARNPVNIGDARIRGRVLKVSYKNKCNIHICFK